MWNNSTLDLATKIVIRMFSEAEVERFSKSGKVKL